ncbi:MAG: TIM barrel protein [Bryobacterales bacterium]|nr:TIM barrel protein [Bryobacterales bacterium]
MHRRHFLALGALPLRAAAPPLKFAHRHAAMMREPDLSVFELARSIGGLQGVELQVRWKSYNLWDKPTLLATKREAFRWGVSIPSLAGIWGPGASLVANPEESLRRSIAAAEFLGASVVLVAAFRDRCPSMTEESSYGPVVSHLRNVAPAAADAGVVLGLETSLSPAGNRKLVDLVGHPAVQVYYDVHNFEFYQHKGQSVPGIATVGKERICAVHLKNEQKLLSEPGLVDWTAAVQALKTMQYDGWYIFETSHTSPGQCIEATQKNIEFVRRVHTSSH